MSEFLNRLFYKGSHDPILQSEAAECGLACLAMVAAYHGHRVDLRRLRARFGVSLKGATLKSIMAIADEMGLAGRPLRLEPEQLSSLETPAILHWDMNHFVVLMKAGRKHITLHDPARGKVQLTYTELSDHFTGVALELRPSPTFEKKEEVTPVKLTDFWSRIKGLKGSMIQAFILSLILQVFALASPLYQQMVVDDAITKQDLDFLTVLAIGFGLMGLINIAITQLRARLMLYFTNALSFQMTVNLFRHLMRLPIDFFEKRHIGDITSRFGALGPIQSVFTNAIIAIILDSIMAVGTFAMAWLYSPMLTMMVIGWLALGFLIEWALFPIRKRKQEEIIHLGAKEQSTFLETIRAARAIKIFGQEAPREALWMNAKADTLNEQLWLSKFELDIGLFTGFIGVGRNILTLYLSAQLVIAGEMTLGMLFAYQSYSGQFSSRISALLGQILSFRMLKLHLTRLADIVHTEPEIKPSAEETTVSALAARTRLRGDIEVRNLSFRYGAHEPWVLKDASFKINAGEMVAMVGPSGAGKTTLAKILIGLLPIEEGEILIDGRPIKAVGIQSFRANLGVVMQDDALLAGSIADNISFFDPEIDMERVETCARAAALHKDILQNPMGYDTLVGDMGSTLSGGQQQRLLIARALYRKPRILFLDEGTANLDIQTETQVANVIRACPITRLCIAHRPALIERADRILLVQDTQVREVEPPRTLSSPEAAE